MDWNAVKTQIEQLDDPYDRVLAYIEFWADYEDLSPQSRQVDDEVEIQIQRDVACLNLSDRLLLDSIITRHLHPLLADVLRRLL